MKEVEEQAQAWSGEKQSSPKATQEKEENNTVQFGGTAREQKQQ